LSFKRSAVASFVTIVVIALAMPALGQEVEQPAGGPGSNLGGYRGQTAGSAISFRPVFPALLPTGDAPVEVTLGLSTANVGSGGNAFGQASVAYPGSAVANIGPLLGQVGPPEAAALLPPYPLAVEASAADGEVQRSAPPLLVMRAAGRPDRGEGETRFLDINLPGLLEIDEIATVSRALVNAGDVTARTEVTLSGVRILGGTIRAGTIRSLAETSSNGRVATTSGITEIAGLKIAGLEATLGFDGAHITGLPPEAGAIPGAGEEPFPGQNPEDILNGLLSALGAEITLTKFVGNEMGGASDAIAQGVLLSIENPLGGTPIPGLDIPIPPGRLEFLLASAASASQASPSFEAGELPTLPPSEVDNDFTTPGATSDTLVGGAGAVPDAPVLSGLPTDAGLTPAGDDYTFDGLSLGLVLGLAVLALCLAWYLRRFVDRIVSIGE
jgi:hypothetical protein